MESRVRENRMHGLMRRTGESLSSTHLRLHGLKRRQPVTRQALHETGLDRAAACGSSVAAPAQTRRLTTGATVVCADIPDLHDTRRDDRAVPMKAHLPAAGGPYPLVIMSHGGGGNRESGLYQAEHVASHGYVVLSIEHPYSNTKQTKFYMSRAGGNMKPLEALHRTTKDAREVLGRPRDVSFAIDQAMEWNRAHPKLAGRIDIGKIGVMGHSFGAYTTLAVCGAQPILDYLEPVVSGPGPGGRSRRPA